MERKLKEIEEIYHSAIEKEPGPKREAYLDVPCGSDTPLRANIKALLKANDEAGNFLEVLVLDETAVWEGPTLIECRGAIIDRYMLLEKIGEGSMAVVYMAEQERRIRRKKFLLRIL